MIVPPTDLLIKSEFWISRTFTYSKFYSSNINSKHYYYMSLRQIFQENNLILVFSGKIKLFPWNFTKTEAFIVTFKVFTSMSSSHN
jgi:hypothetical protein